MDFLGGFLVSKGACGSGEGFSLCCNIALQGVHAGWCGNDLIGHGINKPYLHGLCFCWDRYLVVAIAGVMDCDIDAAIWFVFEVAQKKVLERSAKEKSEWGIFKDMGMKFEGNIADLHREVLGTAKGPICSTVSSLHLKAYVRVDMCSNFISQILSDSDDLRARVNDSCFHAMTAN